MKKIIEILGVAVIAVAMFFSVNNAIVSNSDVSLSSFLSMNTANAEVDPKGEVEDVVACKYSITIGCCGLEYTMERDGTKTNCIAGLGRCFTTTLCF